MPITVVLADDNADHRTAVRFILEMAADVVSLVGEAAHGYEALELVRRERPDLVIADVVMPDVDGLELAALVKREQPQTKVILITAYSAGDMASLTSRSGADAYVIKHEISGLVPTIRKVVTWGRSRE